jgi:hypothetical protein
MEVAHESIPSATVLDPCMWAFAAVLSGEGIGQTESIWTFAPHRDLRLREPDIRVTQKGNALRLVSDVYCHGVHVEDRGRRKLSDNYFELLPRVPKTLTRYDGKRTALRFRAVMPKPKSES